MKAWVVLFLLIPVAYAQGSVFTAEDMNLVIDVTGEMRLQPTSTDYRVDYVTTSLDFFPKDDSRQEVISLETSPRAETVGSTLVFTWEEPDELELGFHVQSEIVTKNQLDKVRTKVRFPLVNLDEQYYYYTQPGGTIDINQDIRNLASSLAEGEDDMYVVVFNIAQWVKLNIEYDLSTVTANAVQKSSWVLDNRYGVCDELTNLFIAMLRSLGIPARFVTGVSYTDSALFTENWGLHGWAEVYFPEYGWIPFDVTYGEFGFVDAGHIKLTESVDSNKSTTKYEWKGVHVNLETNKLNIETTVKEQGKIEEPLLKIDTDVLRDNVGFGSYNLIEATVTNPHNFYVPTEVYMSRSNGYEIIGVNKKPLLLKPNEKKKEFWVVKVNNDLDSSYVYTFNVGVYTTRNATDEQTFMATENEEIYNLEEINDVLELKEESEQKTYSKQVYLDCDPSKDIVGLQEKITVSCIVRNTGNTFLDDMEVCLEKECKNIGLAINQESELEYTLEFAEPGEKEVQITAKNAQVSKVDYLRIKALDTPVVSVSELEFPLEVSYRDKYTISFVLQKDSVATPKNLVVKISQGDLSKTWELEELTSNRKFILNLNSLELFNDENDFLLSVDFEDEEGNKYNKSEKFSISLVDVTYVDSVSIFFRKMTSGTSSIYTLIILSAVIFGVILGIVFRGKKKEKEDYW